MKQNTEKQVVSDQPMGLGAFARARCKMKRFVGVAFCVCAACAEPTPPRVDPPVPYDEETPVESTSMETPSSDSQPWRPRRRMDIDQLNASLRQVLGGVGWTETTAEGVEVDVLESLAPTLGRADYVENTQESLETSALFQKFLGDMAMASCAARIERDVSSPIAERVILGTLSELDTSVTAPAAVDANLSALLLRFHGRRVSVDSPELERWRTLFADATRMTPTGTPNTHQAWRAVCVALLTHPDFYTY